MGQGTTQTGSFGYVALVDKNGNVLAGATAGPQPSASSTSVTPATNQTPFDQNLVQIKGVSVSTNNGTSDAGTQRISLASDGNTVGGIVASTFPSLANGAKSSTLVNSYGSIRVNNTGSLFTGADGFPNTSLGGLTWEQSPNAVLLSASACMVFNGGTWDRMRGDTNGVYTISKGGASINTGQVAVTTSSTLVVAARTGRQKVTLTPTSNTVFYVGNSGVTASNGLYVAAGAAVTLDTAAAVYAVGSANLTISFIELF